MELQHTRQLVDSIAGGYGGLARMVNRGELVRVRRGVVAQPGQRPAEQVLRQRIEAAAPFLGGGTWFSHRSAAVIHGMPVLIRGGQPLIEVIRTMGGHGNRSRHLHARAAMVDADEATWVDGLPVTSLTRTVLDLVKTLPFPEAVMVTDHALRLGLTRTGLIAAVGEGKGHRKAERAIAFADPGSESPPESESRARIAAAGLPVPEIQVVLRTSSGDFIARPDFYWRGKRLVGEYDGEAKYTGGYGVTPLDAIRSEKQRQAALEAAGYAVLRWDRTTLREPGEFERRVRTALASRPWVAAAVG